MYALNNHDKLYITGDGGGRGEDVGSMMEVRHLAGIGAGDDAIGGGSEDAESVGRWRRQPGSMRREDERAE